MRNGKNKKTLLSILILGLAGLLLLSAVSTISASITNSQNSSKSAIAQWSIPGPGGPHIINAIISMSNSEKDGTIYVSIDHPLKGISESTAPINIKWNMNHISAQTTLTFGGPGRTGTHNVTISWEMDGPTNNKPYDIEANGLSISINGAWKLGLAELSIMDSSGHHKESTYTSSWAVVFHGVADISLTI